MINDPNGAAQAPQIRNPGIPVSALAERRLKIMVYLARLYDQVVSIQATPAMITIAEIRRTSFNIVKSHRPSLILPLLIQSDEEFLVSKVGQSLT
jgi:hypothetical protein